MPWTGGAFLVGAAAIAGLPPLNGFASEWLTLQALLHVPAAGRTGDGIAGALALARARGDGGARRALLRQGRRARAARAAAARGGRERGRGAACRCGPAIVALAARLRRARRRAGPARRAGSPALAPWPTTASTGLALSLPGTGSLPTAGHRDRARCDRGRRSSCCAAAASPRPRRPGPAGSSSSRSSRWTSAGFTKPLRLGLETILRPEREIAVDGARRGRAGGRLQRPRPAAARRAALPAARPRWRSTRPATRAASRPAASAPTSRT